MIEKPFEKAVKILRDAVNNRSLPSAAIAIGVKDHIFVKEYMGTTSFTEDSAPIDENTLYDMASVTKIMSVTMIALRFMEEGLLDLADPIKKYLGDFVPAEKESINIFHLMTHTSGLTDHLLLEEYISDPKDSISLILSRPLESPIGKTVNYSCMGFILLGNILEIISGKPLDILAKEYVFSPLKMKNTSYHPILPNSRSIYQNVAYTEKDPKTGEWLKGIVHDENARFLGGVSGNAGVFSTLNDCIKYTSMLACGGKNGNGYYLAESTFQAAIRNYTPGQEQNRGIGFHLAGGYNSYSGAFFDQEAFGHTGFTGPHILVSKESGLYVVLLTNRVHPTRDNNVHLRIRRVLHTAVAAAYGKLIN